MSHHSEVFPADVIPVTIVGGYLGSGKTTLINTLLGHTQSRRYAVLVNDFGELAIDAQLIESQEGDVISLSGGCVCCSYGDDLIGALMDLDTDSIDQVVIESSGVALPGAIAGSVSLLGNYRIGCIAVLADCSTVEELAMDKYLADTIDRQLAAADLIALSKADLVEKDRLAGIRRDIAARYPQARVISVADSQYPLELFSLSSANREVSGLETESTEHQVSMYTTFVLDPSGRRDAELLATLLAEKSTGLIRAKGFVEDSHGCMQTVQVVGRRWSVQPAPDDVASGVVCIGLANECDPEFVKSLG